MRLIDADRLKNKITGITKPHQFVEEIDKRPTVKAIPVEWIKKWCNKEPNRKSLEERLLKRYGVITMLEDWEKENE